MERAARTVARPPQTTRWPRQRRLLPGHGQQLQRQPQTGHLVLVKDDKAHLLRRRETFDDLMKTDVIA
jgi:hypothetical protein